MDFGAANFIVLRIAIALEGVQCNSFMACDIRNHQNTPTTAVPDRLWLLVRLQRNFNDCYTRYD